MHAFPVPAVLACATSAWLPYLVWQPAEAQLHLVIHFCTHGLFINGPVSGSNFNRMVYFMVHSSIQWSILLKKRLTKSTVTSV